MNLTLIDAIADTGIVAAALTALGGLVAGLWWLVRRIVHIADAVEQLVPNGGSSIKDQITRIETKVTDVERKVTDHIADHHGGPING